MTATALPASNTALAAERAVLGAFLLDSDSLLRVLPILPRAEAFTEAIHRDVFNVVRRLVEAGQPVDPITVRHELEAMGRKGVEGLSVPLAELVDEVPTAANVEFHAAIVADAWRRRRLLAETEQLMRGLYDPTLKPTEVLGDALGKLQKAHDLGQTEAFPSLRSMLTPTMQAIEQEAKAQIQVRGLSTGFEQLDELTDGFQAGDQWILAARTSKGKSSLGLQLARNLAREGPVYYVSLEMQVDKLTRRMISSEARVNLKETRKTEIYDREYPRLSRAAKALYHLPIFFDYKPKMTAEQVCFGAQCLKAQQGALGTVVIDYLQLLKFPAGQATRDRDLGEASAAFKALAMELDCRVLLLSQLNRKGAEENIPPELYMLRDSGNLEQDADVIGMVHWPEKFEPNVLTKVDLYVRKNRDGATGSVPFFLEGWTGHWHERERSSEQLRLN